MSFPIPITIVYVAHWDSREIVVLRMDSERGTLSLVERMGFDGSANQDELCGTELTGEPAQEPRGMPLAISPDRRFLYVSLRAEPYSVVCFSIDPASGRLRYLATVALPDTMTYIATDRSGRFLVSASYSGNKLVLNPIGPDGVVSETPSHILATPPKAHCAMMDPANRFLFAASLGGDVVLRQHFDAATGTLAAASPATFATPPGAGPRHFVFHPNGQFLYLLCELDGSLHAYSYDAQTGMLGHVQTATVLPPSYEGRPWAADIHLTPDGRFLYASERGSNTLAAFAVEPQSGRLSPIGNYPTERMPRAFNIDPRGRFLLAVGQISNSMTVYAIEAASGRLVARERYPMGQNPNWVEIVELAGAAH